MKTLQNREVDKELKKLAFVSDSSSDSEDATKSVEDSHEIIRSETATNMYKSLNGLVPEYLSNLFVKNSTRNVRELRNTETDLSLPLRKTKNGQKAISFRGPKLWNELELDLKQAPSLATFNKD